MSEDVTKSAVDRRVMDVLDGAIDLHVHPAPSPFSRRVGIRGVAEQAAELGFRAILVKSHHHSMVTDIASTVDALGGLPIPVYSGIAMNNYVGGINPYAVDLTLRMGGRMVWFPTVSSGQHIHVHEREHDLKFPSSSIKLRPTVPVPVLDAEGSPLPEVWDVLELIRDADVMMSTGHMSVVEIDAVVAAAAKVGVKRIVINHPNFVIEADPTAAQRWVAQGAVIEHGLCQYDDRSTFFQWPISVMLEFIKAVGVEHTILGSDLGQAEPNPLPVDGYRRIIPMLLDAGMSTSEVHQMVAVNTARTIGLD